MIRVTKRLAKSRHSGERWMCRTLIKRRQQTYPKGKRGRIRPRAFPEGRSGNAQSHKGNARERPRQAKPGYRTPGPFHAPPAVPTRHINPRPRPRNSWPRSGLSPCRCAETARSPFLKEALYKLSARTYLLVSILFITRRSNLFNQYVT